MDITSLEFAVEANGKPKVCVWSAALDISLSQYQLGASSLLEARMMRTGYESVRIKGASRMVRFGISLSDRYFVKMAARRMRHVCRIEPMLSARTKMADAINKLEKAAREILGHYGQR